MGELEEIMDSISKIPWWVYLAIAISFLPIYPDPLGSDEKFIFWGWLSRILGLTGRI